MTSTLYVWAIICALLTITATAIHGPPGAFLGAGIAVLTFPFALLVGIMVSIP